MQSRRRQGRTEPDHPPASQEESHFERELARMEGHVEPHGAQRGPPANDASPVPAGVGEPGGGGPVEGEPIELDEDAVCLVPPVAVLPPAGVGQLRLSRREPVCACHVPHEPNFERALGASADVLERVEE